MPYAHMHMLLTYTQTDYGSGKKFKSLLLSPYAVTICCPHMCHMCQMKEISRGKTNRNYRDTDNSTYTQTDYGSGKKFKSLPRQIEKYPDIILFHRVYSPLPHHSKHFLLLA